MVWGMGLLAAGSVVLGVAPQLAVNYFLNPDPRARSVSGAGVHVTWLGLSADAGSFSTDRRTGAGSGFAGAGRRHLRPCLCGAAGCGCTSGGGRAGGRRRRNLHRRRAALRSGPAHGRRLLRDLSAELALVLPLVQCGSRLSGRLERVAGRLARAGRRVSWMERQAAFSSSCLRPRCSPACAGWCPGTFNLELPVAARSRRCRRIGCALPSLPRPLATASARQPSAAQRRSRSGRCIDRRRTHSRWPHGLRSLAPAWPSRIRRAAHSCSRLDDGALASREIDLPCRRPHLRADRCSPATC